MRQISDRVRTSQHLQICDKRAKNSSCKTNANERNHWFFNVFTKKNASHKLYEHFSDHQYTFLIIQTLCRPSGSFSDHPNISRSPGHFSDYFHRASNDIHSATAMGGLIHVYWASLFWMNLAYGPWQSAAWLQLLVGQLRTLRGHMKHDDLFPDRF